MGGWAFRCVRDCVSVWGWGEGARECVCGGGGEGRACVREQMLPTRNMEPLIYIMLWSEL